MIGFLAHSPRTRGVLDIPAPPGYFFAGGDRYARSAQIRQHVAFCTSRRVLAVVCTTSEWSRCSSSPRGGESPNSPLVSDDHPHEATLGARVDADVDAAVDTTPLTPAPDRAIVVGPGTDGLAPLERLAAPVELSGAGGTNRAVGSRSSVPSTVWPRCTRG